MPPLDPVELFSNKAYALAEGPLISDDWLWWVDIKRGTVNGKSIRADICKSYSGFRNPSAVVLATANTLRVVAEDGLWEINLISGERTQITQWNFMLPGQRCNEAKLDPFGNLWITTMDKNETEMNGRLFTLTPDMNQTLILENMGIPNTLAWDTSRDRFYFGDSLLGDIYVTSMHSATEPIKAYITFIDKHQAPGTPDGSTLDESGNLINARWGGGCLSIFNYSGKLERNVLLGTKFPTSCVYRTSHSDLFVTTASLSGNNLHDRRAGHILKVSHF